MTKLKCYNQLIELNRAFKLFLFISIPLRLIMWSFMLKRIITFFKEKNKLFCKAKTLKQVKKYFSSVLNIKIKFSSFYLYSLLNILLILLHSKQHGILVYLFILFSYSTLRWISRSSCYFLHKGTFWLSCLLHNQLHSSVSDSIFLFLEKEAYLFAAFSTASGGSFINDNNMFSFLIIFLCYLFKSPIFHLFRKYSMTLGNTYI